MAAPMTMPGAFIIPSHEEFSAYSRPYATPSFCAPRSPSASSALSSSFQSVSRTSSGSTINTRKRPRLDFSSHNKRTPRGCQTLLRDREALSPVPLVNTDYHIAGGLDTPCAEKVRKEEQNDLEHERDHRVNRYNRQSHSVADGYFPLTPAPAHTGSGRLSSSPNGGWGRTVWDLTGGVAGKVINFCFITAFRGFHAGGGRGYTMQLDTPTVTAADLGYLDTTEDVFDAQYRGRSTTPIPGGFPEDKLIEDYMSHPDSHQYDETPTQKIDPGASSLRNDWVVVSEQCQDTDRSPARKRSRPSTANLYARSTPRHSFADRPRLQGRTSAGGASFASPRASLAPLAAPVRPHSSEGSGGGHKRSRSLIASPRRAELTSQGESSPKSPEVVKFEKKIRRQDHRQNESMKRMNQQMQDMMMEAKQALASKIEVRDDVDDEGYDEGIEIADHGAW